MMHLLRKYDVAPVGRNDAMFAIKCGEADIISVSGIISKTTSFAEGKHHSKNALLSTDKSAFFVGAEDGNRTRIFSLGS